MNAECPYNLHKFKIIFKLVSLNLMLFYFIYDACPALALLVVF